MIIYVYTTLYNDYKLYIYIYIYIYTYLYIHIYIYTYIFKDTVILHKTSIPPATPRASASGLVRLSQAHAKLMNHRRSYRRHMVVEKPGIYVYIFYIDI